ncbi:hypothetical protein ACOJR9_13975 [Alteromonas sp. A081]|uniref:hypothetical protein n=1 Tax=Alteromonas sp. A081 TaxID=3410269 RepID=UPI003B984686
MTFKLSFATGAAALLLMLEAVYAFLTSPELNTHHDSLQTALLFIILGVCYELRDAKKTSSQGVKAISDQAN